jgi:hypothetical protein
VTHAPTNSSFSLKSPKNIGWGVQIIKLLITYFSPLTSYRVLLIGFFYLAQETPVRLGLFIHEISRSHTTTHHSR